MLQVQYADIVEAAKRLEGLAHITPVYTSRTVDELTGASVYFKCENLQRGGAFKFRGAFNAMSQLSPDDKKRGVLTFSSGNHAGALALVGKLLDIPTKVIMPSDAPDVKVRATRGYGAEIIFYDPKKVNREEFCEEINAELKLPVIPPYNHPHTVAGQGTSAKELLEETGSLDYLMTPCGGGGLLSGCAIAAKNIAPGCKVMGVEPEKGDDATRSFHSGVLQEIDTPATIADGARTRSLGSVTFPIILEYVDDMITVSDEALVKWMKFIWERMKLVVEPTGALAAAALLEGKVDVNGKKVGIILSGGNVDLRKIGKLFE